MACDIQYTADGKIKGVLDKGVLEIAVPQFLIKGLAKVGDILPLPLNTKRLKKRTSTLLLSNNKINTVLGINKLPLTAEQGLEKTIKSFLK